jgi:DNA-binding GntR family transcriptional regulator
MIKKILTNRNLRQNVYEEVRNFVVNEVIPGEKINEDELAIKLGVSKTPVREALSKLAHDGIVKIIPNRGSYKIKLSKEDILEIMVIREALEGLCIRLTIANITDKIIKRLKAILDDFETKYLDKDLTRYPETMLKFYTLIYDTAKNQRLIQIIKSMYDLTNMFRLLYFSNPERVSHSLKVHREFIDVLEKRDEELAEKIRKDMIRSAYEYLIETASGNLTPYPIAIEGLTQDIRGY